MTRINGAADIVREWEEQDRQKQDALRKQSRSVVSMRSDGFLSFGGGGAGAWQSLDDTFPSQPRRFALSEATNRTQTSKLPRGATLRGPRTWMRHQQSIKSLPDQVAKLDRYYTEMQNPIGRSAGTGHWRSNSERVVLAISQAPKTQWQDSQAGPETAKPEQGSLLILKVSSGSVQNWRQVSGARQMKRQGDSTAFSSAMDKSVEASVEPSFPLAAHLTMPEELDEESRNAQNQATVQHNANFQHIETQRRSTTEQASRLGSPSTLSLSERYHSAQSPTSGVQSRTAQASASAVRISSRSKTARISQQSSRLRGGLGSRVGATSTGDVRSRPLTESTPTWRNTPSWESSGWYSRGMLIDTALDEIVPPALRHGRSQPIDNSHRWRPRYGALASNSFPFRPPPPQASKLGWSRFPLAGEVDRVDREHAALITQDILQFSPQPGVQPASRSDFSNQFFDNPGGLSRLNPNVPAHQQYKLRSKSK